MNVGLWKRIGIWIAKALGREIVQLAASELAKKQAAKP